MSPSPEQPVTAIPRWHIHRHLYQWVLSWADSPFGLAALCAISFIESSIFPIPPDVLLIALVMGNLSRWWRFAAWCTVASVLGGMAGYGIGVFAWETLGQWIMEHVVHVQLVEVGGRMDIPLPAYLATRLGGDHVFQVYDRWNAWIVYIFALTPLPYKLVTITAGVAHVNIPIFIVASILGRASRFFLVAGLLRLWGAPAKVFIDRYFDWLCLLFVVLLAGGFYAIIKFM